MITVEQALALVAKHSLPQDRKSEKKALEQAQQAVLAQEVVAPIALPPFRQSAMDGYAVHLHDSNSYQIIGTIQAGDDIDFELQPGQACRIFTGAAVPHTANAVVIQELVIREENQIKVQKKPQEGQNIRKVGEQVEQGTLVLEKGFVLNPPALGLLQSLGLKEVLVYAKPKITILLTGNELQQAGKPLTPGKIYESNSLVLQAAL
ncbi:MAG: molybdopterin molybdotransferase MoeA, partial [Flavobacteriaceae bacterium]